MTYALRRGLAWCPIQDRPVFLDLVSDRYFALGGDNARALLSLSGITPEPAPPGGVEWLIRAGILHAGHATDDIAPCAHALPARSIIDTATAQGAARDLPRILVGLAATAGSLKIRSLATVLRSFETRKRMLTGTRPEGSPVAIALRYHHSRRFSMPLDRCLVRALALAGEAVREGYAVTLVFGVQLRPFAAHCWVEHEGAVLDDSLDHVRRFAPILAL